MKQAKRIYLQLLLIVCFALSLVNISPTPALAVPNMQSLVSNHISYLDDCAGDTLRPAIPQSEGAYVANSNTGKFHYASCRYVGRMSEHHKVFYDSREDAAGDGYVACKVCRP